VSWGRLAAVEDRGARKSVS